VRVFAEEGAYDHLVKIRTAPYAPISRETADHSLPYIVAAAVLDGYVRTDSFAPSRVLEPARQTFVAEKVKAAPEAALGTIAGGKHKRHEAGYLGRVEIELADGTVVHGEAKPFPGHPKNPFSDDDLAEKLKENMEPFAGPEQTARLARHLDAIETRPVRDLTALLALPETSGVDAAKTE
jgi:2-methylcitrate dehydratase